LLSLLTEICDPVYLLGLLRASLERYIASQQPAQANGNGNGYGHDAPSTSALIGLKAQASGYLFGFNGMGMCILRLPAPVIEVEAPKLSALATRVCLLRLCCPPQADNNRQLPILPPKCYPPGKRYITFSCVYSVISRIRRGHWPCFQIWQTRKRI
jgi:hypothetical protein